MACRVACLLLASIAISAKDLDLDLTNDKYFTVWASRINRTHETLGVGSDFYPGGVFTNLKEMVFFVSRPGQTEMHHMLAKYNRTDLCKGSQETNFFLDGYVDSSSVDDGYLYILWNNETDGYCRTYTCRMTVVDSTGVTHTVNKSIAVGPPPGSTSCPSQREIPDYIQNAFPDATPERQLEMLDKILSIDKDIYDVSSIYQGRVYIATMKDRKFRLHKMNELCKSAVGYLVELDSPEEQWFVRDFLKDLGHYGYFTGANDVDQKGNFVYYNSKRPMTNVVWQPKQPDNWAGKEDCVEIRPDGLNDKKCSRARGYICEIPLL